MTARPPRASTRSEGKRAKSRGVTQGEKAEKPERLARPERGGLVERGERSERGELVSRGEQRGELVSRGERSDRGEQRGERGEQRGERGERGGGADRAGVDPARSSSILPTDQFERIGDDEVVEVTELPEVNEPPALRVLVLEGAPHLAAAQAAIVAAGHAVTTGIGRDPVVQLRTALDEVDAVIVGLPGGERAIDAARELGEARPLVIAAASAGAVEAARLAAAAGADLVTARPHHVERLAPVLFAAARLIEQRRLAVAPPAMDVQGVIDELSGGVDVDVDFDADDAGAPEDGEDDDGEADPLQPREVFENVVERELERSRRYGYPLTLAMFRLDLAPPPPPAGLRGILRARAGNALVNALRDIDLATELEGDRFLVLLPYTDRLAGAELARRIIGAVAAGDPVSAAGRTFPPKVVGAVAGVRAGQAPSFAELLHDATQLLEQAEVTGASLAVEP